MAYDEALAARMREALGGGSRLTEKRMMGGACFMLDGNMVGGADRSKEGVARFMFRLGKDNHAKGESMPGAIPMIQGGRALRGFFFVESDGCTDEILGQWVRLAKSLVAKLPPK